MLARREIVKKQERVEFGEGILPKLIAVFCDSCYINQENYEELIEELLDTFFLFKREAEEQLTDDELLAFMREQFDKVCFGSQQTVC